MRRQKEKSSVLPISTVILRLLILRQTVVHCSLGYIYRQYACAAYGHQRRKRSNGRYARAKGGSHPYTPVLDMGVKIAYDFKLYKTVDLQLSGGVQNIFEAYQKDFDRGANRDSNYIYGPSLPRSFFAGVKISY